MTVQLNLPPFERVDLLQEVQPWSIADGFVEGLRGSRVIFSHGDVDDRPIFDQIAGLQDHRVFRFEAVEQERQLAAVDSSCVHLGYSEEGSIYAGRVVAVYSSAKGITHYRRLGPVLYHVSEEFASRLLRDSPRVALMRKIIMADHEWAKRALRIRMERYAQHGALNEIRDGVLMIDGSLRSSVLEDSMALRRLVDACLGSGSTAVGISKSSRLNLVNRMLGQLSLRKDAPCLAFLEESSHFGVQSTCVKFSNAGIPVRMDVAGSCGPEESGGIILGNEVMHNGYPESLRLAHHLSVFSKAEVLSLKSYLVVELDVRAVVDDDRRAALLGRMP